MRGNAAALSSLPDSMRIATLGAFGALFLAPAALAQTAQPLPFSQNWTNTGLITTDNVWTGVPGIIGYRGDDATTTAAISDVEAVTADLSTTPLSVLANKTSPGTESSGGVYEFEIADPTVAFQGSGTADTPHIVIRVITTGLQDIRVRYNLRDLDDGTFTPTGGSPTPVDAVQPVALQFRAGTTGAYTNVSAGFVADASSSPGATLVTPVDVILPAAANNKASVDIRIITANAAGSDEMIGIDDINITGSVVTAGGETPDGALTMAVANPLRGAVTVRFSTETTGTARLALYDVLGRRVATIADGVSAGDQTATLDTAGMAPGVYLLRLDAGGRALTQTVTVIR